MKNAVKLFSLFFVLGLLFVIVGCTPDVQDPVDSTPTPVEPTPTVPVVTDYNALGGWSDGGDGVYTLTTNITSELEFSYAKGAFPYAYLSSAIITQDLSVYKKLVITVEGTGTMLLKLETSDGTPAKEVGLNVTGIQGTYEWNLLASSEFLSKVNKIVIIAAPGKEDSVGEISITTLKFGVEVASGFIINDGFDNIPSNVNEYNGTDVTFNFNSKWENFAEQTYTITPDGTAFNVQFTKAAGFEWSAMQSRVQGNFTNFNFVVVKVTGTAGQPIIVKAANNVETRIILNGEMQEVVVDLSDMLLADKNAITSILIFGNAGRTGTGQFTIHEAFMIDDYAYEAPVVVYNEYNGTDASFDIHYWVDGGDQVYSITKIAEEYLVEYNKNSESLHYAFMVANLKGDYSSFATIEFEITGQANKSALLKVEGPNGNKEMLVSFDGTKQLFTIDLSTLSPTQLSVLNKVLIMAGPGSGIAAGEFTIHNVTFKNADYVIDTDWVSLDAGVYTVTDGLVSYNKGAGQEWSAMVNTFDPLEVEGLNTMTVVLKGEVGKSVMIKPNDAFEDVVTFTDTNEVTRVYTAEAWIKLVMIAEGGTASVTGSFEIVSIILNYVEPDLIDPMIDVTKGWEDSGDGVYTFVDNVDGSTKVNYTKGELDAWSTTRQLFTGENARYNVFSIEMTGVATKQVLVKVNNSIESWVTFDSEGRGSTIVRTTDISSVLLFGEGGVASVTGSFTIVKATLAFELNVNADWEDSGDDVYTFINNLDGSVTVNYVKVDQEWSTARQLFGNEAAIFNTFTISFSGGTPTKQVMVKMNNVLEKWLTFDAEGNTSVSVIMDEILSVHLFAEGGVATTTGSFEIDSAVLSYTPPQRLSTIEVKTGWMDNGDSVYTITENIDGSVTFDYVKVDQPWATAKLVFEGELVGYNTITLMFSGTAEKQVLVKVNNAIERWVTFDAEGKGSAIVQAASINEVLLFAEGGVGDATGSFILESLALSYEVDVNSNWFDNGDNVYTFVENAGQVTVNYVKVNQGYPAVKQVFAGDYAMYNVFTIVMTGTAEKQVLVKVNNQVEVWVTFDAEGNGKAVIKTGLINEVLLFAEGGVDTVTGSFVIVSADLSYIAPVVLNDLDVTIDWADNGDSVYTFVENDGNLTVNYTKVSQEWSTAVLTTSEISEYNTFTITMTGTATKQVLVKVNNIIEQWVTFDAEGNGTATVSAPSITQVLLFAEGGVDTVTGSFVIISAILSLE
jgi:hypothetical protein